MNLFLVCWSPRSCPDGAELAARLRRHLDGLPWPVWSHESWTAPSGRMAAACAHHVADRVPGAEYSAARTGRFATFSGRPITWRGERSADGRGPLHASIYLDPTGRWSGDLDGAAAVVRCDDDAGVVELWTDPLGMHAVYHLRLGDVRWLSDNAGLLAVVAGADRPHTEVAAHLAATAASLSGQPLWPAVERVPWGALHRWRRDWGDVETRPHEHGVATAPGLLGRGWYSGDAAATLVEIVRAQADWPGRPVSVSLSGGRDSRLVLAAAARCGLAIDAETTALAHEEGHPRSADVTIAAAAAARAGFDHRIQVQDTAAPIYAAPLRAMSVLSVMCGGAASLEEVQALSDTLPPGPLPLRVSGLAGEIARRFIDLTPGDETGLAERFTARYFHPLHRPPVTAAGRQAVLDFFRDWVGEQLAAGVPGHEMPDVYFLRRIATRIGSALTAFRPTEDAVAPFTCGRLLPHVFGPSLDERRREVFHHRCLEILAPALVGLPFPSPQPRWTGYLPPQRRQVECLRIVARRGRTLARRRMAVWGARGRGGATTTSAEAFARSLANLREPVLDTPHTHLWEVIDRRALERLLNSDAATFDAVRKAQVWRAASVLLATPDGAAG